MSVKVWAALCPDFITGAKSGKEALADFAKNIINTAVSILTEWLGVFAIYSAFPTWASGMTPADMANKTVFGITKKAAGGYITGPGTGTSDSIPAMLSKRRVRYPLGCSRPHRRRDVKRY